MKKNTLRAKLFLSLFGVAITIVLAACVFSESSNAKSDAVGLSNYTKNTLYDLEVGTAKLRAEDAENYVLGINYPFFKDEKIDNMIKGFVESQIYNFKEENKDYKPKTAKEKAILNISFSTYQPIDSLAVVLFKISKISNGATGPEYNIVTKYYNLKTGTEILVENLMEGNYLQFLSNYCSKEFKLDKKYKKKTEGTAFRKGIAPVRENYQNIIFRKNSVEIIFSSHQVFPGHFGRPIIQVPIKKIKPYSPIYQKDAKLGAYGYTKLNPNKPMIALTFDDGPHEVVTVRILDQLRKNNVNATFFMLGERAAAYPKIVKRMYEDGNEVANHSYNHTSFTRLNSEGIKSQLQMTDKAILTACGVVPRLIRPPYGAQSEAVRNAVDRPLVMWSVDPRDWSSKNKDSIVNHVLNHAKDGDIILMHDLYPSTAEASEVIIPALKERGFQLVTVSEMIRMRGIDISPGVIIRNAHK